jgi:hypothetical protein
MIDYIKKTAGDGRMVVAGAVDNVTVGETTTAVLAADAKRSCVVLSNISSERIDVALGADAEADKGIGIPVTGVLVLTAERGSYMEINAICASGSKTLAVQTITEP